MSSLGVFFGKRPQKRNFIFVGKRNTNKQKLTSNEQRVKGSVLLHSSVSTNQLTYLVLVFP